MVSFILPTLPSADTQRSSRDINNLESRTTINDVIAPEECQAFLWAPQWVCLGFQLKQTLSALKNVVHALRQIYLTFGHWGVLAASDISDIRTLKVNKGRCKITRHGRNTGRFVVFVKNIIGQYVEEMVTEMEEIILIRIKDKIALSY